MLRFDQFDRKRMLCRYAIVMLCHATTSECANREEIYATVRDGRESNKTIAHLACPSPSPVSPSPTLPPPHSYLPPPPSRRGAALLSEEENDLRHSKSVLGPIPRSRRTSFSRWVQPWRRRGLPKANCWCLKSASSSDNSCQAGLGPAAPPPKARPGKRTSAIAL